MGSGKSQGAIGYINAHPEWKFIVVTPYLKEIERFITECPAHNFKEPIIEEDDIDKDGKPKTKTDSFVQLLNKKENVVTTHVLFAMQMEDIAEKYQDYHLIIDESLENAIAEVEDLTDFEVNCLFTGCLELDDDGYVNWKLPTKKRTHFEDLKELSAKKKLKGFELDDGRYGIFKILPSSIFQNFEEVIILTYLFEGQIFKGYLDIEKISYDKWYVKNDDGKYLLTAEPQPKQIFNYKELVTIHGDANSKINKIGAGRYSLSHSWYMHHTKERKTLGDKLYNYFHNHVKAKRKERMWTAFGTWQDEIAEKGHYARSFVECNARATNEYKECTKLAYLVNRFIHPNIAFYLQKFEVPIDERLYALQEMLQWIWRSAIRDGKPIEIYIPSERMRSLLIQWLDYVSGEKEYLFEPDEAMAPFGDLASEK